MQLTPSIHWLSKAYLAGRLQLRSSSRWLLACVTAVSLLQSLSADCNCGGEENEITITLRGTIPGFKVKTEDGTVGPASEIKVKIDKDQEIGFVLLSDDDPVGCNFGTVNFPCDMEYQTKNEKGGITDWAKGAYFSADTVDKKLKPVGFRLKRVKQDQGNQNAPTEDGSSGGSGGGGGGGGGGSNPPPVSTAFSRITNPGAAGVPQIAPPGITLSIPLGKIPTGASGGAPYLSAGQLSWAGPIAANLAKPTLPQYHGTEEVAGRDASSTWGPAITPKVTFTTPVSYPQEKHVVTPTRLFRLTGYTTSPSAATPLASATSTYVREYVRGSSTEPTATTLASSPVSWWQVSAVTNGVKVNQSIRGVARTFVYSAPSNVEMNVDDGFTSTSSVMVPPSGSGQPYSIQTIVTNSGVPISKKIQAYKFVQNDYNIDSESVFPDLSSSSSLTTTYGYYPASAGTIAGSAWWVSRPSGSWTVYQYDTNGNQISFSPFESETLLDPAHTDPNSLPIVSSSGVAGGVGRYRKMTSSFNGAATQEVCYLGASSGVQIEEGEYYPEIAVDNVPEDAIPDNLVLQRRNRTVYYSSDIPSSSPDRWLAGKTILTSEENGSATYYEYQSSGAQQIVTETTGIVSDQDLDITVDIWLFKVVPNLSRRIISTYGIDGIISKETLYNTGSGFTSAQLENYYYQDGVYQRTEIGGLEVDRVDRPDPLTMIRTDRTGRVTTQRYSARGDLLSQEMAAGGGVPAIRIDYQTRALTTTTLINGTESATETIDGLGRIVSRQDPSGTTVNYLFPYGGRDRQMNLPGGIVRYEENYLDGTLKAHSGSGWVSEFHSTGVNGLSGYYKTQSTGLATGHSSRTVVSYYDVKGNLLKQVKPSPSQTGGVIQEDYSYSDGQMVSVSPSQIDSMTTNLPVNRLYLTTPTASDAVRMGGDQISGFDIDGSEGLTLGLDRVKRRTISYELLGGIPVQKNRDYVYPNATTSLITETIDSLGLVAAGSGTYSSFRKVTQPSGRSVTETSVVDRGAATIITTADDSSTPSTADKVTKIVNGYLQTVQETGAVHPTTYSYDSLGRVKSVCDPRGSLTSTYYTPNGQIARTVDQLGLVTAYSYYGSNEANAGALRSITKPGGITELISYNELGLVTQIGGSGQYARDYTYDAWGALVTLQTHGSQPSITRWSYQPSTGLVSSKRYNDGNPGSQGYDFEYTPDGKISKRTTNRVVTTYTYSPSSRDLTNVTYSDSVTPSVTYSDYDGMGRPHTITEGTADVQTLDYDPKTGLGTVIYGPNHRWLKGVKVQQNTDSTGRSIGSDVYVGTTKYSTQSYHYDAYNRVDQVNSLDVSSALSYLSGYDKFNDIAVKNGTLGGSSVVYDRNTSIDMIGRTADVINKAGSSASALVTVASVGHIYDSSGRRSATRREDGAWWDYQYNDRSEVIGAVKKAASNFSIPGLTFAYSYDGVGNLTSSSSGTSPGTSTRTYTPDALNQYDAITHPGKFNILTRSDPAVSTAGGTSTITPTASNATVDGVDQEGNLYSVRLTASNGTTGTVAGTSFKKGTADFGSVSKWVPSTNLVPVYDQDGNLSNDGRWDYTWDGENRLIAMIPTSSALAHGAANISLSFEYDWLGRRIGKKITTNGTSTYVSFAFDGWNPVAEWSSSAINATLTFPRRTYLWGPDISSSGKVDVGGIADFQKAGGVGGLIAATYYSSASSKTSFFPGYDANGNVIAWTDSTGTLLQRMDYDPFGNAAFVEKLGASVTLAMIPSMGFSTKLQDVESGLYYYGYRFYDSATGRWLSRDPQEEMGGLNLYGMVGNNPVNSYDRLGLQKVEIPVSWGSAGDTVPGYSGFGGTYVKPSNLFRGRIVVDVNAQCSTVHELKNVTVSEFWLEMDEGNLSTTVSVPVMWMPAVVVTASITETYYLKTISGDVSRTDEGGCTRERRKFSVSVHDHTVSKFPEVGVPGTSATVGVTHDTDDVVATKNFTVVLSCCCGELTITTENNK